MTIEESDIGKRLDVFTSERMSVTRSAAQKLIEDGFVTVNDKKPAKNYRLKADDEFDCELPEPVPADAVAQDIPIDIVYEDSDLLVVNKPRGMVVHPAPGSPDHTLVNALLWHVKDLSGINGVVRPGIVHRIDKNTSGLLIVAKKRRRAPRPRGADKGSQLRARVSGYPRRSSEKRFRNSRRPDRQKPAGPQENGDCPRRTPRADALPRSRVFPRLHICRAEARDRAHPPDKSSYVLPRTPRLRRRVLRRRTHEGGTENVARRSVPPREVDRLHPPDDRRVPALRLTTAGIFRENARTIETRIL